MLGRTIYAAVLALLLVPLASADLATEGQKSPIACLDQDSTKDITQGGAHEANPFHEKETKEDENIVKQITGDVSDSRKMGIGALLVLISSVLYAGFNWNDDSEF